MVMLGIFTGLAGELSSIDIGEVQIIYITIKKQVNYRPDYNISINGAYDCRIKRCK